MSKAKKEVETQVEDAVEQVTEQAPVSISMNDLQTMYLAIKTSQERGAFRVEEMQAVGAVATKVRMFIEQQVEKETAEKESTEN